MTDIYLQLRYDQYKDFEDQLRRFSELETTHTTDNEGFYHKAFRIRIGDITLEVQGPFVKKPLPAEDEGPHMHFEVRTNGDKLNTRLEGVAFGDTPCCLIYGATRGGHSIDCVNYGREE